MTSHGGSVIVVGLATGIGAPASANQLPKNRCQVRASCGRVVLLLRRREVATWSRAMLVRTMGLNHWYHHRGELVVYLRLLGLPVPVVYERIADENPFAATAA
jgi:DinB family